MRWMSEMYIKLFVDEKTQEGFNKARRIRVAVGNFKRKTNIFKK